MQYTGSLQMLVGPCPPAVGCLLSSGTAVGRWGGATWEGAPGRTFHVLQLGGQLAPGQLGVTGDGDLERGLGLAPHGTHTALVLFW